MLKRSIIIITIIGLCFCSGCAAGVMDSNPKDAALDTLTGGLYGWSKDLIRFCKKHSLKKNNYSTQNSTLTNEKK